MPPLSLTRPLPGRRKEGCKQPTHRNRWSRSWSRSCGDHPARARRAVRGRLAKLLRFFTVKKECEGGSVKGGRRSSFRGCLGARRRALPILYCLRQRTALPVNSKMRWPGHLAPPPPPWPPLVFMRPEDCPFALNIERFEKGGAPNDNTNGGGGLDRDFWEGGYFFEVIVKSDLQRFWGSDRLVIVWAATIDRLHTQQSHLSLKHQYPCAHDIMHDVSPSIRGVFRSTSVDASSSWPTRAATST